MLLFVYGQLKSGFNLNSLLQDQTCLGEVTTLPEFGLYRVSGFPGMIRRQKNGVSVKGELWEVSEDAIMLIDEVEGVDYGLFKREKVDLTDGKSAFAYIFNGELDHLNEIRALNGTASFR